MRHARVLVAASAATLVAAAMAGPAGADSRSSSVVHTGHAESYLVLTDQAGQARSVADHLRSQGATIRSVNTAIGMVEVRSDDASFRRNAAAVPGVDGVAKDQTIGHTPRDRAAKVDAVEREHAASAAHARTSARAAKKGPKGPLSDPLDSNLWGMKLIRADQAHQTTLGSRKVRVGIIDTGVQGDHPDIAPNFDAKLSRNFTTDNDNNVDDGPCEHLGCVDPVGEDDNGHGTHVAGTIAAAMNGYGVSGVAPDSTIVNVRAGQDSGYFFAGPVVNALTYAGDAGIDVVNMSFYVDPWLYNCKGGAPQDTPEQAADQDTIITAVTRALNYAHGKHVTMLAAAGNDHTDVANPGTDLTSPDFGPAPHPRTIDNSTCYNLPLEGPHVLGITSVGPSTRKADYSNWSTQPGSGEVELAAPGGWFRDGFGTPSYRTNENLILSDAPLLPLQNEGLVDSAGNITPAGTAAGVKKECQAKPAKGTTPCGYFQWLQGTSMATPHATGVAALAVARHGTGSKDGLTMAPDAVRRLMMRTANDHACPPGGVQSYTNEGRDASYTATCVGTAAFNGFYGDGIVNALGVVR